MRLVLTLEARRDLLDILAHSRMRFGLATGRRYRQLLEQAFVDLSDDPGRAGVSGRPGLPPDLRFYHLRHSRGRIPERVVRPRHLVVFRVSRKQVVVLRVLHDAMDLAARLPRLTSPR